MTPETVPTPTDTGELTGYAVTAAELRRLADVLDTLPPGDKPLYTHVSLLPGHTTVEVAEAIAIAVTGESGKSERRGDGWLYLANSSEFGKQFSVGIQATVPGPPDPKDAELERLRAEVASLRSAEDPDHGRTTAVGEARPDTLLVPHGEAHRTSSVQHLGGYTTYFSFGHGQTDPDTGESLLGKYVTVIAPTYEACREAMFASRYGERWSFDYPAGTATAAEWIPQWTEHDRIVVDPNGGE